MNMLTQVRHRTANLPHQHSTAPNLNSNGSKVAAKPVKPPRVADRADIEEVQKGLSWRWVLVGLAVAASVTGHFTNVTPSHTIARLTGDETAESLATLDEFGVFTRDGGEISRAKAYRSLGRWSDDYYGTSLKFEEGGGVSLNNRDRVGQVAAFLRGEDRAGLTEEELGMARRLSQDTLSQRLDKHGATLAFGLKQRYGFELRYDGDGYDLESNEDLRLLYDVIYGSGEFLTPREQEVLPLVVTRTKHWSGNAFQVLQSAEQGRGMNFTHTAATGRKFERRIESREQLFEFAYQLEGQIELDRYQPTSERLQALTSGHLDQIGDLLAVTGAQVEALKGLASADQAHQTHNQAEFDKAEKTLRLLRTQIDNWKGGPAEEFYAEALESLDYLEKLPERLEKDRWDVYSGARQKKVGQAIGTLREVLKITQKDPIPEGWVPPAVTLEGH